MTPAQQMYEADRIESVSAEWDELGPETRKAYEREAKRYGPHAARGPRPATHRETRARLEASGMTEPQSVRAQSWTLKADFMPAWLSRALLSGQIRPTTQQWWIDGIDVGAEHARPGDEIRIDAEGRLSVHPHPTGGA